MSKLLKGARGSPFHKLAVASTTPLPSSSISSASGAANREFTSKLIIPAAESLTALPRPEICSFKSSAKVVSFFSSFVFREVQGPEP